MTEDRVRDHCDPGLCQQDDLRIEIAGLLAEKAALVEALTLLVADVADYEAWQRPCHALEVARAVLRRLTTQPGE